MELIIVSICSLSCKEFIYQHVYNTVQCWISNKIKSSTYFFRFIHLSNLTSTRQIPKYLACLCDIFVNESLNRIMCLYCTKLKYHISCENALSLRICDFFSVRSCILAVFKYFISCYASGNYHILHVLANLKDC